MTRFDGAFTLRRMLKRTPFYEFHVSAGAKLVDFAGWEMPLLYRSIVDEHEQTRKSGSIFDVSHMGRLSFSGRDAQAFLNRVLTRNVSEQVVGQSKYSLVCNEGGGILDDVIVSRDAKNWMMVCNASNRAKLVKYFGDVRRSMGLDFDMADNTEASGMVALQGPKVIDRLAEVLPIDLWAIKRYHFEAANAVFFKVTIFRSGYTGEDGVEVVLPAKMAGMAIKMLAGAADKEDATIKPAGLGARDTLRMEAAMPLYGHELNETSDPLSAGLGWAVDLTKDFVGAVALREIQQAGLKRKLVGLELEGKRIARQGTAVKIDEKTVGEVTSGTLSPTLGKSIAMAYVDVNHAAEGTQVMADLKGMNNPAKIVKLPFYKRAK
ncbi:MAG TPA: glycine cleavage system aminomethyltransferase GcvT [Tepidisphaeraceae bacterium]|nr:glycine cleavage system aminomethyltransferase GcvT [Tepidisphaeraceae bacterium]